MPKPAEKKLTQKITKEYRDKGYSDEKAAAIARATVYGPHSKGGRRKPK